MCQIQIGVNVQCANIVHCTPIHIIITSKYKHSRVGNLYIVQISSPGMLAFAINNCGVLDELVLAVKYFWCFEKTMISFLKCVPKILLW